jgi:hypothetical protein
MAHAMALDEPTGKSVLGVSIHWEERFQPEKEWGQSLRISTILVGADWGKNAMKRKLYRTLRVTCKALVAAIPCQAASFDCPTLPVGLFFPADNPWHYDISKFPVHPNSANLVASVGNNTGLHPDFGTEYLGQPMGIPYIAVGAGQAMIPIEITDYADESDPGPMPIPLSAPIEGGSDSEGDRHVLVVDTSKKVLYELYSAIRESNSWIAASAAIFNLQNNDLRPEGFTSADAAGLPILPGLVRHDEVTRGYIDHAIRMTAQTTRRSYLYPARHQAGSTTSANAPAMGERFRLKAQFDVTGFPPSVQVILKALKTYGFIVADNGSNWYFSGSPHSQWDDEELNTLKRIKGSDFEAVLSVDNQGNPLKPAALNWDARPPFPSLSNRREMAGWHISRLQPSFFIGRRTQAQAIPIP